MNHVIYNANGAIIRVVTCPDSMVLMQVKEGEFRLTSQANVGADDSWVSDGVLTHKSSFPFLPNHIELVADLQDTAVISNVPAGSVINWFDGVTEISDGGDIELSVDLPGKYWLSISSTPYLIKEITIEAIAAT